MDPLRWLTRFLLTLLGVMVLGAVFAASAQAADDVVLRERAEYLDDFATGEAYETMGLACEAIYEAWSGGDHAHYLFLVSNPPDVVCSVWYREDDTVSWTVILQFPEARVVEWPLQPVCPAHDGLEPTIVFRTSAQCSANDPACDGYPGPVHMCEYRSAAAKCSALQGLPVPSSLVAGFTAVASCAYPPGDVSGNPATCAFAYDGSSGQYKWTGALCNGNGVGNVECDKLPLAATAYRSVGTASGGNGTAGPTTWASGPSSVPSTVCSGSCRYSVTSRSAWVYPSGWSGAGTTQVAGRYELVNLGQICTGSDVEVSAMPGFTPAVVQGTISAPTTGGEGGASGPSTGSPANEAAWGNYGQGGSSSGGSGSASGGSSGSGSGAVGGSTSGPSGDAASCTHEPCDGWTGSCEAGFQCTGDPVQCAQAQAAHTLACSMKTDPNNVAVKEAGEALAAAGSSPDGGWGAAGSTKSFALGSFMGGTFGPDGGCPSDVSVSVAGGAFVLPFSSYCSVLSALGLAGNAISMVIAIGIVFGRRGS